MLLTVYTVCFFICLADLEFTNTKLVLLFKLTLTRNMMGCIGLKKISYDREKNTLGFSGYKIILLVYFQIYFRMCILAL